MIPASTALAQTAAGQPTPRFVAIFYPHGMAPGYWVPENVGALPAVFPDNQDDHSMTILKSLEPVRELQGGRHVATNRRAATTGNLLLSILDLYGIHQESQGDSTGRLAGL